MSDVPIVPMEALLAHEGWLRGLARSLVLDDARADDVVQETWATALREPPRAGGSIRAWLASVVRSRAADARKSERRRAERETAASWRGEAAPGCDPVVDAAAATEIHRRLTRAVMELDEPYRSAVILRFFEGLPPREVGARTGVPAETARTRVNRGLAILRERLDGEDGGRRKWTALLVPIAGLGLSTETNGPSAGTAGAAAMASAKTFGTAAALVALCVGAWWWLRDDGVAAAPSSPGITESAKSRADAPARPPRAREEPGSTATPPDSEAASAPSAPTPPGAAVRLRFVDENGAPLPPQAVKARWGGGLGKPSVALLDDRDARSADRSDWLRRTFQVGRGSTRPAPLDETSGAPALSDRVPPGRWRLVVSPAAAPSTLTRPFTVARDGDAVDVDVVLAATPFRLVRVIDPSTGCAVAGARLTPYFEYDAFSAPVAGPAATTDAEGEARLPIDDGDAKRSCRPPTWWATAPGRIASFQVRSDAAGGGAALVIALEPTCDVEGEAFLADGSPAAGRSVSWSSKGMTIGVNCDAAGRFRLADIPAGAAEQPIFLLEDAARGIARRRTVQTTAGRTATVRFDPPASDTARVVVRLTAGGRPVRGLAVTCRRGEGGTMALTDSDGSAVLAGIASGAQPTIVVLLCDPRVAEDFTATATPTPLAAGEVRKLSLDLPVGVVRVRVVAADGSPVPGAHVVARPADKSTLDRTGAAVAPSPEDWAVKFGDARFADDDGAALLTGLPVGATCEVGAEDDVAGLKASTSVVPGTSDAPAEVTLTLK